MAYLNGLPARFPGVDFLFVYIAEAHSADLWPIGLPEGIESHKTMAERVEQARAFSDAYDLTMPIVCDPFDDQVHAAFAAWPVRYYIVGGDACITYKAQPDPEHLTYLVDDFVDAIREADARSS